MFLMDAFGVGGRNNSLQGVHLGDVPPGQSPGKESGGGGFDQYFN